MVNIQYLASIAGTNNCRLRCISELVYCCLQVKQIMNAGVRNRLIIRMIKFNILLLGMIAS